MASSYPHVRHSALGTLLASAVLVMSSCSEQYADVVILDPDEGQGASNSGGEPFDDSEPGTSVDTNDPGLADLCQPCDMNGDCGGNNDICLVLSWLDGFCGMDCNRDADCPIGYQCTNLLISPDLQQCTPASGSCADPYPGIDLDPPSNSELRLYVLDLMNEMREAENIDPLRSDDCLDDVATEALDDLERTMDEGYKFRRECEDQIPSCRCNWQADSQVSVPLQGFTSWQQAVERPFERAYDPGSTFHEVYDEDWTRVGVAVDFDRDYVHISVEFAPDG